MPVNIEPSAVRAAWHRRWLENDEYLEVLMNTAKYGLTAEQVPLVTVTPNPQCLFVAGTNFESEGDPTRTCNAEHDHVSCGRCPYPGR